MQDWSSTERLEREALSALLPEPIDDEALAPADRLARVESLVAGGKLPRSKQPRRAPAFFYPGLSSRPFHDPESFEWYRPLLAHQEAIAQDLATLEASGQARRAFHTVWPDFTASGQWAALWIRVYGEPHRDNAALCGKTLTAVDAVPGTSGWLGFSALAPRTHLRAHCGVTNAKLRCHLPVELPAEGCRIRVGDEVRRWEPGRLLVFDDSFEHEVWNDSDERRVVLIFDVFHPDLVAEERAFLARLEERTVRRIYNDLMARYRETSGEIDWLGVAPPGPSSRPERT